MIPATRSLAAALILFAAAPPPAAGASHRRLRHAAVRVAPRPQPAPRPEPAPPSQPPLDDLYRRRGYGLGGPVFGADTALAGSCADLRFAQPTSCGRGYGLYGNGLGARFGH